MSACLAGNKLVRNDCKHTLAARHLFWNWNPLISVSESVYTAFFFFFLSLAGSCIIDKEGQNIIKSEIKWDGTHFFIPVKGFLFL